MLANAGCKRRIQNPVPHQDGTFCDNSYLVNDNLPFNYFHKKAPS